MQTHESGYSGFCALAESLNCWAILAITVFLNDLNVFVCSRVTIAKLV
jgi:hypothetical protein